MDASRRFTLRGTGARQRPATGAPLSIMERAGRVTLDWRPLCRTRPGATYRHTALTERNQVNAGTNTKCRAIRREY